MPESLLKLRLQFMDYWGGLGKSQKTRILVTSGIVFVAVVIGLTLLTRTTYVTIATIQNSKDATEVQKILEEKKIKYKPGDGGKTILVDSKDKNAAELALQTSSMYASVTFEDTWNSIKMSSTESDKKQLWQNFKKNSLIAKLKMFDNVADADVVLSLPEKSTFALESDSGKATASVRIKPKGEISQEQVQGIIRVVASAVEGLDPKDVTVVDNNFNVLSSENSDEAMGRTSTQYKMTQKYKEDLERNVKKLYAAGSDNFDQINVVANPVLDFNKGESTTSDIKTPDGFEPGTGATISKQNNKETLTNGATAGEPGVGTNPGVPNAGTPNYPITAGNNGTYKKEGNTENFDYKRIASQFSKALGGLNLKESSMTVTLWYGKRVTDENKLSQQFMDQLKKDVSAATGIDIAKISINKYKMAPPETISEPITNMLKAWVESYGYFVLLLLLIGGVLFSLLPRRKKEVEPVLPEEVLPTEKGTPKFIIPEQEEELPEISLGEKSELKKQIDAFAKKHPDSVAHLLRNWLQDDW